MEKYLIAIPCMDSIPTITTASLTGLQTLGASKFSFLSNSLVYDARNMLAAEALDTGADRVLFLDSDMVFPPDLMVKFAADLEENNIDFISAPYVKRKFPTMPLIYKTIELEDGKGKTEAYLDYPQNELFPVAGAGFGAVMITSKLLKAVYDNYGPPFYPIVGALGEDLSFCWRARQLGYTLYCDSRIKLGHIGSFVYSTDHYLNQKNGTPA